MSEVTVELVQKMINESNQSTTIEWTIFGLILTSIISIIGLIIMIFQFKHSQKEYFSSNKQHDEIVALQTFDSITRFIDDEESLLNRRIIYAAGDFWLKLIKDFNYCIAKFEIPQLIEIKENNKPISEIIKEIEEKEKRKIPKSPEFVNHAAWKVAVNYDRVCFLISQNDELKKEIIKFHGATILKSYIIIQGLMKSWMEERGRSDHPYFINVSKEIWNLFEKQRINAIANLITSQKKIYIRDDDTRDATGKISVDGIDVKEIKTWGEKIFGTVFTSDEKNPIIIKAKERKNT